MTVTPEMLNLVVPIVLTALGYLARLIWKDRAAALLEKIGARSAMVRNAVDLAYHAVNDIASHTTTPIDDKIALALGLVNDYLKAHGDVMTDDDATKAKIMFQAMHGAVKGVP